jgi:hypothetical protein
MIEKIDKNDKVRGLSTYAIIDKVNEIIDFLNDINQWISTKDRLPECENGAETEALLFRLKTGTVIAGYFGRGGVWRDKYFRHYKHKKTFVIKGLFVFLCLPRRCVR